MSNNFNEKQKHVKLLDRNISVDFISCPRPLHHHQTPFPVDFAYSECALCA